MQSSKKKILYVITKSNFGGAQRYVFELAKEMQEAGHRVAVASAPEGMLVDKLKTANITHFPIGAFQRDISVVKEFKAFSELRHCYHEFKPDIVHLNSSKAGGLGSLAGRLERVPSIVFTAHGWPFLEPRKWWWKGMAWAGSFLTGLLVNRVILVSKNDLEHTNMPFVKSKCKVIKTAVPEIKFLAKGEAQQSLFTNEQISAHDSDTWLCTIAELQHNKNLTLAIKAVAKHNRENEKKVFYSVIGEGERKEELGKLIREEKAEEFISLLGYVEDARKHLKAFDIFLLPSKKEGMPYTVLEAGLAKLPILASRVGGIPEIITDNAEGSLFSPNSVEELVQKLKTYVNDKELRQEHAVRLKNKISREFSLDEMIKETESLYSSMIDKSGAL